MIPFPDRYEITETDRGIFKARISKVVAAVQGTNEVSFDVPLGRDATLGALVLMMRETCKMGYIVHEGMRDSDGNLQLHFSKVGIPYGDPAPSRAEQDPQKVQAFADIQGPIFAASLARFTRSDRAAVPIAVPGANAAALRFLLTGEGGTDPEAYGLRGAGYKAYRGMNLGGAPSICIYK